MSIKVSVWDKILKVIIAVASAIAGVIGGQAIGIYEFPVRIWKHSRQAVWSTHAGSVRCYGVIC